MGKREKQSRIYCQKALTPIRAILEKYPPAADKNASAIIFKVRLELSAITAIPVITSLTATVPAGNQFVVLH